MVGDRSSREPSAASLFYLLGEIGLEACQEGFMQSNDWLVRWSPEEDA